jgi:hypothetical protein
MSQFLVALGMGSWCGAWGKELPKRGRRRLCGLLDVEFEQAKLVADGRWTPDGPPAVVVIFVCSPCILRRTALALMALRARELEGIRLHWTLARL